MTDKLKHIGKNSIVSIGEEDEKFKQYSENDYFISISAQGKTVEFGIDEELYDEIDEEFAGILLE